MTSTRPAARRSSPASRGGTCPTPVIGGPPSLCDARDVPPAFLGPGFGVPKKAFFSVGGFQPPFVFVAKRLILSFSREFSFSRAPTMATTMMALDDRLDETRATTDATPTLTSF
jgi:hypothetical protein